MPPTGIPPGLMYFGAAIGTPGGNIGMHTGPGQGPRPIMAGTGQPGDIPPTMPQLAAAAGHGDTSGHPSSSGTTARNASGAPPPRTSSTMFESMIPSPS